MNYDDNPINQEFGDFLLSDDWLVVEDELRIPRSISSSHTSDSLDQYIYDTLGGNHQIHSGLTSNNAITTSCSVASHDDPNPNPLCDFSSTDSSGVDEQLWSKKQIQEIQEIIDNPTNPVGKFLRDSNISAEVAATTGVMSHLVKAPRKPRAKYGKRTFKSKQEREQMNRERNRNHAQATRRRKKLFKEVLALRDKRPYWSNTARPSAAGYKPLLPRTCSKDDDIICQSILFLEEDEVDYTRAG